MLFEVSGNQVKIRKLGQDYTSYMPSWKTFLDRNMCIKFESVKISITEDYCSKSHSKEEDRGKDTFALREDEAI